MMQNRLWICIGLLLLLSGQLELPANADVDIECSDGTAAGGGSDTECEECEQDTICEECEDGMLVPKPDSSIQGDPCNECSGGQKQAIMPAPDPLAEDPCKKCDGGSVINRPDHSDVPNEFCKVCIDGQPVDVVATILTPPGVGLCQGSTLTMSGAISPSGRHGLWSISPDTYVTIGANSGCISFKSIAATSIIPDHIVTVTFRDSLKPSCSASYTLQIIGFRRAPTVFDSPAITPINSALVASTPRIDENRTPPLEFSIQESGTLGMKYKSTDDTCVGRYQASFRIWASAGAAVGALHTGLIGGESKAVAVMRVRIGLEQVHAEEIGVATESNSMMSVNVPGGSVNVPLANQGSDSHEWGEHLPISSGDNWIDHSPGEEITISREVLVTAVVKIEVGYLGKAYAIAASVATLDSPEEQPTELFKFRPRIPLECSTGGL